MSLSDELFGVPQRTVMDPVHGGIGFFFHEAAVIDQPLFQRLRFIVQNDITSLVFPGATHTRFQHSLGAMHIAGRFLKAVLRSYLGDPQNQRTRTLSAKEEEAIRYFYFCLRLAALLHDSGHFPFSHQFESADAIKEIFKQKTLFTDVWKGEKWKRYHDVAPKHLTHEHYSVRVAHEVLKKLPPDPRIEPIDVLALMEKTSCKTSATFNTASKTVLGLLLRDKEELKRLSEAEVGAAFQTFFQSIISGELDIDKMDYLLRDSFYTGSKYGMYNLDHLLLNTLRVGFTKEPYWVGLAITEKGVGAFEDFVHSRFQLYQHVYSHKTVVGFKWLLKMAMKEVLSDPKNRKAVVQAVTDTEEFSAFTDMFFWERFRGYASKHPESASDRLIRRKPLKHLQSGEDFSPFRKNETSKRLKTLLRESQQDAEVLLFASPIKFSKVSHPTFETLRVLVKAPITRARSLQEIKEKSKFFEKFHDIEITHFYIRPKLGKNNK